MTRKVRFVVVLVTLVALLVGFASPVLADKGGNGKGKALGHDKDKGVVVEAGGAGSGADAGSEDGSHGNGPRHPSDDNGGVDPGEQNGALGPGDHGMGTPSNGSAHANCNAAGGEVDPECEDEAEPPAEAPPEDEPPANPPVEPPEPVVPSEPVVPVVPTVWTREVCLHSNDNAVEVFGLEHDYDERYVIGESWDVHCEHLMAGWYSIRPWNHAWGHGPDAPLYVVHVSEPGPRIDVFNPLSVGVTLDFGGVTVERMPDQGPQTRR